MHTHNCKLPFCLSFLLCWKELSLFSRIIVYDYFCKNPWTGGRYLKRGRKRGVKGRTNWNHRVEVNSIQFRLSCIGEIKFKSYFFSTFNLRKVIFFSKILISFCNNFTYFLSSIKFSPYPHCLPTSKEFNDFQSKSYKTTRHNLKHNMK